MTAVFCAYFKEREARIERLYAALQAGYDAGGDAGVKESGRLLVERDCLWSNCENSAVACGFICFVSFPVDLYRELPARLRNP